MKTVKVGQRVAFTQAVIRRCGHESSKMRGTVLEVHGNVARVDTAGTWTSPEGNDIRSIPIANLTLLLGNGAIFGD